MPSYVVGYWTASGDVLCIECSQEARLNGEYLVKPVRNTALSGELDDGLRWIPDTCRDCGEPIE